MAEVHPPKVQLRKGILAQRREGRTLPAPTYRLFWLQPDGRWTRRGETTPGHESALWSDPSPNIFGAQPVRGSNVFLNLRKTPYSFKERIVAVVIIYR
jgi:hypothetical protein